MVAAARLKRCLWPVAAAVAVAFVGVLAFHGERPEPGLARFEPAGLLAKSAPEHISVIELKTAMRDRVFRREPPSGWRADGADRPVSPELAAAIETGLKLLHNTAPQRTDLAAAQAAEFGLAPPHLTLIAKTDDGAGLTVEFGGINPLGLECYARIVGENDIMLLPVFVADAWQPVVTLQ